MKRVLLLACFFLCSASVCAVEYYADVEIDVSATGTAAISGTTNHPMLSVGQSDEFTSREGKYWVFEINLSEEFSDYVYSILLPEGASIDYLKASKVVRITNEGGRIAIKGVGRNEFFSIQIQYSIEGIQPPLIPFWVYAGIIFAFFIITTYLVLRYKKRALQGKA